MRHLISLLGVAAVLSTGPAHAGDITWTGFGDGASFGDPFNWSPMSVPGQFDTAIFNKIFPLVSLGSGRSNQRLSVLLLGDGTLDLSGDNYFLSGAGPPTIEIEGSITISDGLLWSNNEALIHPSGSMTVTDLHWNHAGVLNVQGSLTFSQAINFTSVISSQGSLAPGSTMMILNSSSWEIADLLDIEGSLSVSSMSSVVSGFAEIRAGGSMTMTDESIWINNNGGININGSLNLFTNSEFSTNDVIIGANGSVMIDTNSILSVVGALTMFGGGGASLSISNFSTVTATIFEAGKDVGVTSLTIDSGGSLILSELIQNMNIAQHPDSNSTVIVDDGILFNPGPMVIGEAGTGSLTILNHGNVFCSEGKIANTPGAVGTVTVTGTESENTHTSWEISGNLHVGDGGTGSLLIENGAEVSSGSGRIGQEDGLPGTVTVTGFDSGWQINGELEITPGNLTISAGGFVSSGDGLIGGGEAGSATVTGAGSAWFNTGLFIIGPQGTGALDIADSGLVLSDSGLLGLFPGSSGTVTVDGPGSDWIDLSDIFVGYNGSGTLNITNGGSVSSTNGFVGSFAGSDGTAIVDGPGSTWTNLVSLAVGNFGTGSLTVSNGGTVATPQVTVSDTGEVLGDGILAGNVTNSGVASPGLSIGTLNIQGDYVQTPTGVLDIELSASGGDRLAITGTAELSNTTLMLSVITGDEPSVGQMFTVLTAASISGQDFTVIGDGGQYNVTMSLTDVVVTVVALPCLADVNNDNSVNVTDLLSLLAAWGPCGAPCPPDINTDGFVNVTDLLALLAAWGACP